jgi:hypothetical protein
MRETPKEIELPIISLEQTSLFDSKVSPIYNNKIFNDQGEQVGRVDYQLNHQNKTIIIPAIEINKTREGYGKAVYKYIQDSHQGYQLKSSDSMTHKTDPFQEFPDAVRLWESLVKAGLAEKTETGYQMKI